MSSTLVGEIVVDFDAETLTMDGVPFPYLIAKELEAQEGSETQVPSVTVTIFANKVTRAGQTV